MVRPRIALIGAGQQGSTHARVIAESSGADLEIVVDSDLDAAHTVAERHWSRSSADIAHAMHADAVVIASSTASHLALAVAFLDAGVPTFVEKPLAPCLGDVDQIIHAAARTDTPVMCGFVERFNPAFRTAVSQVTERPDHVMTVRHSPPAPRIDSSAVSDMLLHDLDMVINLFGGAPGTLVGAVGHRPDATPYIEVVDCVLRFDGGMANLSANRMGQRKVRSLTIHGGGKLIEVDLLRQNVTVYRNVSQEMTLVNGSVGYHSSTEIDIPFVRHTGEPLALQFAAFLNLVNGKGDHVAERAALRSPHVLMDAVETAASSHHEDARSSEIASTQREPDDSP